MFKFLMNNFTFIFSFFLIAISTPNIFIETLYSKDFIEKDSNLKVKEDLQKYASTYVLGAGDLLSIQVYMSPEYSGLYSIGPDGYLYLPELGGFNAIGYTVDSLNKKLTNEYSKYLKNPQINIFIASYRPVRVYVSGEVEREGFYTLSGTSTSNNRAFSNTPESASSVLDSFKTVEKQLSNQSVSVFKDNLFPTVFDAIRASRGITSYSDLENIKVIRKASKSYGNINLITNLNFLSLFNEGDLEQNIRVFDGDRIIVNKSDFNIPEQITKAIGSNISPDFTVVYVSGEVKNPGRVEIPQGASLSQAIALAGGQEFLSGNVEFIRFKSDGSVDRRKFRLKKNNKPNSYKNPRLKTGDVINIQYSEIRKISKLISEFTTPFVGIYSFYNIFN